MTNNVTENQKVRDAYTYRGEALRAVTLPMGGIGCGSVALAGDLAVGARSDDLLAAVEVGAQCNTPATCSQNVTLTSSAGAGNRHGHPAPETLVRLGKSARIYSTVLVAEGVVDQPA